MRVILPLLLVFFLMGCGEEEILHYQVPKEKPKAEASTSSAPGLPTLPSSGGEFKWEAPEGWAYEAGSGMRFGTFKFEVAGEPAECTLVKLGAMAGGLGPNVNRWRGQIGLANVSEDDIKASMIELDGKMGKVQMTELINPDDSSKAILATIINGEGFTLFVKIMATQKQIEAAKADFSKLSASIHLAE